ncbi:MAG: sialidase family protein, partial [bacterium]
LTSIAVVPLSVQQGTIAPSTPVTVLAAGAQPNQMIHTSNFSGDDRIAAVGNYVYALVTTGTTSPWTEQLYVSSDGGQTWGLGSSQSMVSSYPWSPYGDECVAASSDGTVYILIQQPQSGFSNWTLQVFTSTNHGADPWVMQYQNLPGQKYSLTIACDPLNPGTAIASYSVGTCGFLGVRTTNGAAGPFNPVSLGFGCDGGFGASMFFAPAGHVYHVSVRNTGTVYVRRSDNGGASWPIENQVSYAGSGPFAYGRGEADWTDPTGLTLAYSAAYNSGTAGLMLAYSTDGGVTTIFKQNNLDTGFPQNTAANGVRYDPCGQMMVYWVNAGTMYGRLSNDDGATFSAATPIASSVGYGYVTPVPNSSDFFLLSQTGVGQAILSRTI